MSQDLNELKKIRTLKSDDQFQLVNQLEQKVNEKETVINLIAQTIEMYKENKVKMETALFEEIEGQVVDVEGLQGYSDKMQELTAYGDQLEQQYLTLEEEHQTSKNELQEARDFLTVCRNDVEKIDLLLKEEQKKESLSITRAEENELDEQATMQWNSKG